jgi:hypothetical protein
MVESLVSWRMNKQQIFVIQNSARFAGWMDRALMLIGFIG